MKELKRIIFLILFWAVVWLIMALGHEDKLKFLEQNLEILVIQIVIIVWVTYTLAPRILSKKNNYLFIGLGFASILVCAFLAYQFSFAFPSPDLPPNLPTELSHKRPPMPRARLTPLGRILNRSFLVNFLILCLTFFLTTVIEVFLFAKVKEEALILSKTENLETELKLLKSQINPHFLFNALNNIYALSAIDSKRTQESISYLSNMLRYVLYDCEKPLVSLQKEVAYIEDYIKLFVLKSSKNYPIETQFNISDSTITIAPMLLIPFVENAFKHSNIEAVDNTYIKIKIDVKDDEVSFEVENTIAENGIAKDEVGGIGLENVKKRLSILYPEQHDLKISEEKNVFKVSLILKIKTS
ncbi:sensor histidine kinase [Ulvibacter antarcticus]|uniref:GHKL domain-containing protein n=1 Tax=Ulvibacter antarcticus TaxID=442714 RepID=A0A3L9ZDL9_9FLAO|nr:histidine kinase [Ulvibacter antarcticus]RMA64762.1 GHKL domain-containing protein [Ulvibacter antarcticus]